MAGPDSVSEPNISVSSDVNNGLQAGHVRDVVNPVFKTTNNYHGNSTGSEDSAYLRALMVNPEDLRTNAVKSISDSVIDRCWNWILDNPSFKAWLEGQGTQLLWISGSPGKGKSVMVIGLVDELVQRSRNPSSEAFVCHYFCHNMDDTANTAGSILRGLIFGLAQKKPSLIQLLRDKYNTPDDINSAPAKLEELWSLLRGMLANLVGFETIYLVVDALDECHNDGEVLRLLELIRKERFNLPNVGVKWLLTSRPSLEYERIIGQGERRLSVNLDMEERVSQSVELFIDQVIKEMDKWSTRTRADVRDFLLASAESTFIYVSFIWKRLRSAPESTVPERLLELRNNRHGQDLYQAYGLMMNRLLKKDQSEETTNRQEVLRVVLLAKRPLGLQELVLAAGLPRKYEKQDDDLGQNQDVEELIQQCGNFLRVGEGRVYVFHKSVKDFLTTTDGQVEQPFLPLPPFSEHARIAHRCLTFTRTQKNRNFDDAKSIVNRNPTENELKRLDDVAYPYCYWVTHALEAREKFSSHLMVKGFFEENFLPWLEAMGHLRRIPDAIGMMQELINASSGPWAAHGQLLQDLVYDAFRFILRYQAIIKHDPTQVYFLAISFTPKNSLVRQNYKKLVSCCLKVANDPPEDWGTYMHAIRESDYHWGQRRNKELDPSRIIGFSEGSSFIFSSSRRRGKNTLRWHVRDGSLAESLEWGEDEVAISSDGQFLAFASSKNQISVRSIEGRHLCCQITIPSDVVAASFSSNGQTLAAVFVDSYFPLFKKDMIVKIWEVETGDLIGETKLSRKGNVGSMALSPDGSLLAMCSELDGLILWDIEQKTVYDLGIPPRDTKGFPSVTFSPCDSILITVATAAITFWSTESRQMLARLSPRSYTTPVALAISSDGKTAVIADKEYIVLWDLEGLFTSTTTSEFPVNSFGKHCRLLGRHSASFIQSLAFSPCGGYIACARNDGIITLWNLDAASQNASTPPERHQVVFSPDGKICATNASGRLELWGAATGSLIVRFSGKPTRGGYMSLFPPWGFSLDSKFFLAVLDGALIQADLSSSTMPTWTKTEGIKNVTAFDFSHDNTLVAIATEDSNHIDVLDTKSGSKLRRLQVPVGRDIFALAFSPTATCLIAGGRTYELFFWDNPLSTDDHVSVQLQSDQGGYPLLEVGFGYLTGSRVHHFWKAMKIAFSPDGTTIAVAWTNTFGAVGTRRGVTVATIDGTGPRTLSGSDFAVVSYVDAVETNIPEGSLSFYEGPDRSARALAVIDSKHVAVAWDVSVDVRSPRGDAELWGNVSSLSFQRNRNSILMDGISVPLNAPTTAALRCDLGMSRYQEGQQQQTFTWVTLGGERILCLPDDVFWDKVQARGKKLAATHSPGVVSFFSIEAP